MPPIISQALWIAQNAQYIIALFLLFTTLLLSLLGYLILRYLLSTSILSIFSFSAAPSGGKGRGKAGTPKKKVVMKGRSVNTRQSGRGKGVAVEGGILGGVYRATISALGTGVILCALVSLGICIWSLTARGCETLRHVGLIELLPWKTGLKCYRTRWDWVIDVVSEVVFTVLQKSEYGSAALKGINMY